MEDGTDFLARLVHEAAGMIMNRILTNVDSKAGDRRSSHTSCLVWVACREAVSAQDLWDRFQWASKKAEMRSHGCQGYHLA